MARQAPRLPHRRLDVLDARHRGAAQGVRHAVGSGQGLRLPGRPPARALQRPDRAAAGRVGRPAAHRRRGPDARGRRAPAALRRAGRRRQLQLLRPPGPAFAGQAARLVPGAPQADRQLPAAPAAHHRGQGGRRRNAAVAVGQVPGQRRPTRRVLQAQTEAGVDQPGRVRRPARLDRRARAETAGARPGGQPRDPDDRHHADRPGPLPGRRPGARAPWRSPAPTPPSPAPRRCWPSRSPSSCVHSNRT